MASAAFATGTCLNVRSASDVLTTRAPLTRRACARRRRGASMQLPPPAQRELEPGLTEEQRGPEGYKWNPDFPGTLKPGTCADNFPLEDVLASGVYERMKYEEVDTDECRPVVHKPDVDLLEWLSREGRLIARDADEEDLEQTTTEVVDEDLEFADDDDKMLAYYSRQREGSAAGASADFGGFSESSTDTAPGF